MKPPPPAEDDDDETTQLITNVVEHNPIVNGAADAVVGEKRKTRDESREEKENDNDCNGTDSARHPLWKTSMCSYFRGKSGNCSHGEGCRFAHSEDELRPRPDNSWDPTSERAKKMMRKDEEDMSKVVDEVNDGVAMTEAFGDDEDGADPELRKCLVHLPRKWSSDNLRDFLNEQVRIVLCFFICYLSNCDLD